jgi:hypothetical protein
VTYIEALLREQEGYRKAGPRYAARLLAVNVELARLGIRVEPVKPVEPEPVIEAATAAPPERAVKARPSKS